MQAALVSICDEMEGHEGFMSETCRRLLYAHSTPTNFLREASVLERRFCMESATTSIHRDADANSADDASSVGNDQQGQHTTRDVATISPLFSDSLGVRGKSTFPASSRRRSHISVALLGRKRVSPVLDVSRWWYTSVAAARFVRVALTSLRLGAVHVKPRTNGRRHADSHVSTRGYRGIEDVT